MTPDERRHGTSKSGWCMTTVRPGVKDCEHCRFAGCTHDCHGANVVVAQGDAWDNGGTKTAPAGNRGLTNTTVRSL